MKRVALLLLLLAFLAAGGTTYADGATVTVITDTIRADLRLADGAISQLALLKHHTSSGAPVMLVDGTSSYVTVRVIGDEVHDSVRYHAPQSHYELPPHSDSVEACLTGEGGANIAVSKCYTFRRRSYEVDVTMRVTNRGAQTVHPTAMFELADTPPTSQVVGTTVYTGPAVFTQSGGYQKISSGDIAKGRGLESMRATDGWVALVRHYFAAALIPSNVSQWEFFTRQINQTHFGAGVRIAFPSLATGASSSVTTRLFAGPQYQQTLDQVAPSFGAILDYGALSFLSIPLFLILQALQEWTSNWGWAIVLLTVALRMVLYPLTLRSFRTLARMQRLSPQIRDLQVKCGNDRKLLSERIMDLYEKEKLFPGAGLIPLLLQIPVFVALFAVLQSAVELRGVPWFGWITDLSSPDPLFILPIVMGIVLLFQAYISPVSAERWQTALKWGLPPLFTIAFLFVPSGLVLYWTLNSLLAALQQWYITRVPAVAPQPATGSC